MLEYSGDQVADLSADIHADNVAAGWWTDLHTGESLIGKRNFGELLMLVTSELCEAADGWYDNLPDDKLPMRQMFEVELADAAIRILDLLGACRTDVAWVWENKSLAAVELTCEPGRAPEDLFRIVCVVRDAMEGHRKGRVDFTGHLVRALRAIAELAEDHGCDLLGAIADKRAFNAQRADHKPANRKVAGGKAY